MINITGILKLPNSELICYNSPKIDIVGQSSNRDNVDLLNITLLLKSQTESTTTNEYITIDTSILKSMSDTDEITASYMVTNLYDMLEILLIEVLKTSNPDTIFEIITK